MSPSKTISHAAAAMALCLSASNAFAADAHWSYQGAEGPEHWSALSEEYAACGSGMQQSPIDIDGTVQAELGSIVLDYKPIPLSMVNNGHTIQVNAPAGSSVTIEAKRYALLQLHFHSPSEHAVGGVLAGMEVHFVNQAEDGSLAVLGALITGGGEDNATLADIWARMPTEEGAVEDATTIEPLALLPTNGGYVRYYGSLTTPPCSETVLWTVLKDPVAASTAQIEQYHAVFGEDTNRPLQPVSRRFILSID